LILKRNIYNTIPRKISSQNCMMMMYSLQSTPHHSPCHHLLTTAAPQMSRWLLCGRCWLLSDWYHIGYHNEKNISPNNNTTQYLQILPSTQ